jgi:hypothetical protein
MTCVAVIGGYGAVGAEAARQLVAWGAGDVIVAGRDEARAQAQAEALGGTARAAVVDVDDRGSLAALCAQAAVVINCAGPSCRVLDRVARAAVASGAHYVDAGGDDPVHRLLGATGRRGAEAPDLALVLSAGMLPGLTGLLPRALAADGFAEVTALDAWVGGLDRFTETAAADFLASLRNGFGRARMVWRNGRPAPATGAPGARVAVPFFPDPVVTHPYLSTETERVVTALDLRDASLANVFAGDHVRAALSRVTGEGPGEAAALVEASGLDLFGRRPFQRLVFRLAGRDADGRPRRRALVLSGTGASALTGSVAALAARSVAAGEVPAGARFAADALDPVTSLDRLRTARAVTAVEIVDDCGDEPENGAL